MNIYSIIRKAGADFIQVNISDDESSRVNLENQKINDFRKVNSRHVKVSAWVGKKFGYSIGNKFTEKLVRNAIKTAKASENLDFFYGLPNKNPVIKKSFTDRDYSEGEIFEISKSLIVDLKKGEIIPETVFEYDTSHEMVINSEGVDTEEKLSSCGAVLQCVINNGEVSYWDSLSQIKINRNALHSFAIRTLDNTRELRNPVKLNKVPDTVILRKAALAQLMSRAFLGNFSALNVIKKRSSFYDKIGKKVFSDKLSIIDSGIMEEGIASSNFDDEGTQTGKTPLVENGIVKNFISDFNTAKYLGVQSTGNSSGGGIGFGNIIIEEGKGIEEDDALIIDDVIGAHTSNEITTEFSVKSQGALLLKNGEKRAVNNVMISGKLADAFASIKGIGNHLGKHENFYIPEIAFANLKIIEM